MTGKAFKTVTAITLVILCVGCMTVTDTDPIPAEPFLEEAKEEEAVTSPDVAVDEVKSPEPEIMEPEIMEPEIMEPEIMEPEIMEPEIMEPEPEPEPVIQEVLTELEIVPEQKESVSEEPEPWFNDSSSSGRIVSEKLSFPLSIKPVYKTAIPVIVRGEAGIEDWQIVFSYRTPDGRIGSDLELKRNGADFTGRIQTGLFPGSEIQYSYKVFLPGENEAVIVNGGRATVLNNGPSLYSVREMEAMFRYEPLFDVEKRGDTPGFRKTGRGWEFRSFTVPAGIKRWSFDVLYRKKGTTEWFSSGEGVNSRTGKLRLFDSESEPETATRQYDLNISGLKPGEEIEYCFRLNIFDTNEELVLFTDNPPAFRIID